MSELPSWEDMVSGANCPMCTELPDVNQFNYKVADLSVSRLLLEREQTYTGYCVLMFKERHVTGLEQLTDEEYTAFMSDLRQAAKAITAAVNPDHMNYATLGNIIPHLHYHIIPRTENDPRWRGPVWTTTPKEMVRMELEDDEYRALVERIKREL